MSGIAGILRLNGQAPDRAELVRMRDALAHRGPDGADVWTGGAAGLVHLALNVTPEAQSERGVVVDGDLALVADVRLDNRDELLGALGLRSSTSRPTTDPELLLAAYRRWGTECPERLLGAFAFAVWDGRERRLFLARDPFGVKPLVYAHVPGRLFAFASEPKAVLEVEGVSDALDDLAVAEHLLVPVREDITRTFFRDVRALAPAHTATAGEGDIQTRRYWALDPEREVRLPSDAAYAEAFRDLFEEAVRCRLRSATPASAMVSGGLDSSSIASVAAALGQPPPAYSAVYPDVPASDESAYIDAVVREYDLPSHRLRATDASPLAPVEALQWHTDRPLSGGNLYVNWHLYGAASADGSRAVLDGFDGDTTVSHGMGYFNELRHRGRYLALTREVKAFAEAIGEPWRPAVWSWMRGPVLRATGAAHVRRAGRAALRYARTGAARAETPVEPWRRLLDAGFVRRVSGDLQPPVPKPVRERDLHLSLLSRPTLLHFNEVLDAVSAARGVEARLPFFDRRLVEFCLALPPEQKIRAGQSRYVLRQAMAGVLPEAVRLRGGKTSIQHAFDRGLRHFEADRIRAVTDGPAGPLAEFLDPAVLNDLGTRYLSSEADPTEDLAFWRGFSLALWLQRRPQPRPSPTPPLEERPRSAEAAPLRAPLGTVA